MAVDSNVRAYRAEYNPKSSYYARNNLNAAQRVRKVNLGRLQQVEKNNTTGIIRRAVLRRDQGIEKLANKRLEIMENVKFKQMKIADARTRRVVDIARFAQIMDRKGVLLDVIT